MSSLRLKSSWAFWSKFKCTWHSFDGMIWHKNVCILSFKNVSATYNIGYYMHEHAHTHTHTHTQTSPCRSTTRRIRFLSLLLVQLKRNKGKCIVPWQPWLMVSNSFSRTRGPRWAHWYFNHYYLPLEKHSIIYVKSKSIVMRQSLWSSLILCHCGSTNCGPLEIQLFRVQKPLGISLLPKIHMCSVGNWMPGV